MSVTLELEPEIEITAIEQAKAEGLPLAKYVETVVKESVLKRRRVERLAGKSFDEILKPFRDDVEASGLSDNDLSNLFRQSRCKTSKPV